MLLEFVPIVSWARQDIGVRLLARRDDPVTLSTSLEAEMGFE
jgi:hypothetical protein